MPFGSEFFNVRQPEPGFAAATGDPTGDDTDAIDAAVRYLAETVRHGVRRGGYLYFPPGVYRIRARLGDPSHAGSAHPLSIRGTRPLRVPSNVVLWFDPGAMLSPDPYCNIEIAGTIRAGAHQIFDVSDERSGSTTGRVLLVGMKVPVAQAAWWGAGRAQSGAPSPRERSEGLQRCFDAAWKHRSFLRWDTAFGRESPEEIHLPPIPVALSGTHELARPLVLDGTIDAFRHRPPFVVRGDAAPGDSNAVAATVRPHSTFVGDALVVIHDATGFVIDGVTVDAAGMCRHAVLLESDRPAPMARFRDCTFLGATQTCVQIGRSLPERRRWGAPGSVSLSGAALNRANAAQPETEVFDGGAFDVSGLSFSRCRFATEPSTKPIRNVALEIRAPRSAGITLEQCVFEGRAAAMILAWSGAFDLLRCTFENSAVPDPSVPPGVSPNGEDVFIGAPVVERTSDGRRLPGVPASVRAVECDSRSARFLASFTTRRDDAPRRLNVLVSVRHGSALQRQLAAGVPAPSVVWGGAGPLDLIGCSLQALYSASMWPVRNVASATGPVTVEDPATYQVCESVAVDASEPAGTLRYEVPARIPGWPVP